MTTSAHRGPRLRGHVVRVPSAPAVVTVVHGQRHLRLWRRRVVVGALIGGAMLGALLAVVWSVRELGASQPVVSLRAYGIGAATGAAAGLVVGVLLSVLYGLVERYLLPNKVLARRTWVRYRR